MISTRLNGDEVVLPLRYSHWEVHSKENEAHVPTLETPHECFDRQRNTDRYECAPAHILHFCTTCPFSYGVQQGRRREQIAGLQ